MNHFLAALQRFELRSTGKWFLLSAIIGLVAGLGAIGFHAFGQAVQFTALQQIAGFHPREAAAEGALFEEIPSDENQQSETKHEPEDHSGFQPWLLVLVMAGGGLASGLLVYTFAPEAES